MQSRFAPMTFRCVKEVLDSAILHALNDAIDERLLEASVVSALNRIRAEQDSFPDQRLRIQRELSLIEARCRRLLDLMGDGKGNQGIVKELVSLAERQERLQQDLQRLDEQERSSSSMPNGSPKTFGAG